MDSDRTATHIHRTRVSVRQRDSLPLWWLAAVTALLPILGMHGSYLLAAAQGHVPWCVPYWDSCTSISATGRELPEKIVFKLAMMPAAVCTAIYWGAMALWLRQHGIGPGRQRAVLSAGVVGAVFWMLYTATLGEIGDLYQDLRRTGIVVFFGLTFIAQLLCSDTLFRQLRDVPGHRLRSWAVAQLRLCQLMLLIGTASVILDGLYAGYDGIEDAIEWWLALMLTVHPLLSVGLWREQRFSLVAQDLER